jgi:hypothetical protein
MEAMSPEKRAVDELSHEGIDRLASILMAGSRPTIAFWRKYRCAP